MRGTIKTFLYFLALLVVAYIGYLAATYIDETVVDGEAYGFKIGASKQRTFSNIRDNLKKYPNLVIYISYGPRAGDYITLNPMDSSYSEVAQYDSWWLLLDGKGKFFNIISLGFHNDHLVKIQRHRQYFELP